MDVFLEQMIKRKKTVWDFIKILLCMVCVLGIFLLLPAFLMIPGIGTVLFAICVIAIYLIYRMVCGINLEYEYTFTNGSMDVDKIINAKQRKSMLEINIRKIEIAGDRKNPAFASYLEKRSVKKVYACTHRNAEDLSFVVFQDKDGKEKMLLFNPNEELREAIRRFNPQKVSFS